MVLRRVAFLFLIGLFLSVFAWNIVATLSPFDTERIEQLIEDENIGEDEEERLDQEIQRLIDEGLIFDYLSPNAYSAGVLVLLSIVFFVAAIHISVEKLFFRKYYESPSYFDAFRRGAILAVSIGIIIYMNLYGFDVYTMVLTVLVAVLLEVSFVIFLKKPLLARIEKNKEQIEGLEKEKKVKDEKKRSKMNPVSVPGP